MGHSIDISQLKNNGKPSTSAQPSGKNIDGTAIRDFGNGLKEMDPSANGFEYVKIERKPNDKDRALQAFDEQMRQRREEVEKYNELLDQYGGQISEEELREELNQGHITQTLHDGAGDVFEDEPGKNVDASTIIGDQSSDNIQNENIQESSEMDELERELEMEDMKMDGHQYQSDAFVDPNLAKLKAQQEETIPEETAKDPVSLAQAISPKINTKTPEDVDIQEENPIKEEQVVTPNPIATEPEPQVVTPHQVPTKSEPIVDSTPEVSAKESVASGVKPIEVPAQNIKAEDTMSEEDKDLKALDDDTEEPVEDFDEKLKQELAKKMRPVSKKFDLANAVVVDKAPVTVTNALADVVPLDRRVFTWGLYRSKRPIAIKGFTATELNNLGSYIDNASRSRDVFKAVWDHIVRGQGRDFDAWMKTTSYYDVDHIWFAVYGACFSDSNYLPYTCDKCNEVTVSADIPLERMCKFKNEEIKEEFSNILKSPFEQNMGSVFAEYRVQVSDSFVIGLKEPSIYDAVIVPNTLDAEFRTKYRDIIGLNAYISNIYKIMVVNNRVELHPIAVKQFVGNETKSIKARIIQYAKIIRSLTSDQYNIIMGHINSLNDTDTLYYRLPSISCDHCKKEISEERQAAADLVFMRHRLAILGV